MANTPHVTPNYADPAFGKHSTKPTKQHKVLCKTIQKINLNTKKLNLFITPSLDGKCHVKYAHRNVNVIDLSKKSCHFFEWSQKNGNHHWLPVDAIRFLEYACAYEHIDLQLNANTKKIVLNADGKNIEYFLPNVGQYTLTDCNGNVKSGDSSILYNTKTSATEYHIYTKCHSISTINRTDYTNGLKLLLIGDSMTLPWVLCLAPICSKLTYIDNRKHHDLSRFHLNDYDKCLAAIVNHPKIPSPFVLNTLTYFANQITSK